MFSDIDKSDLVLIKSNLTKERTFNEITNFLTCFDGEWLSSVWVIDDLDLNVNFLAADVWFVEAVDDCLGLWGYDWAMVKLLAFVEQNQIFRLNSGLFWG